MLAQAQAILRKYYGYEDFREGQKKIIASILERKDTLGVMPTGGGKSICYQVPAMLFDGVTIVISPLISLMKDQTDFLQSIGIPAAFINSTLSAREMRDRIEQTEQGAVKLLYVAPERFEAPDFMVLLRKIKLSFIAIDEAHCMSQWGHDFRPSYRSIGQSLRRLPVKPLIAAFTATATPEVMEDICEILSLRKANRYVTGFQRPNLAFSVVRGADKQRFVEKYVQTNKEQAGIIYAATRKEVDQLHQFLAHKGLAVGKYHAGLTEEERRLNQEQFLYDDLRIMVATNAFGMGIDKSNVRYVLHYNLPRNIESYYQEAGRAGRDGEKSECVLLFNPRDIHIQKFLIEQSVSSAERKSHEYTKLQAMVDYCYTQQCLQTYIVQYFGDQTADVCGRCSNCLNDDEQVEITEEAQKIISCVKRMNERFGAQLVAKVLKGSKDHKVLQFGFNRLPTYGIMENYTLKDIGNMINLLVAEGYLTLTEGQYPTIRLSPLAVPVIKGEQKVWMRVHRKRQAIVQESELFERLRALRKRLAEQAQVPPYVVFSDSTLQELCQYLPRDREAMLAIKGIGEAKLEKYGELFLGEIKAFVEEKEGNKVLGG